MVSLLLKKVFWVSKSRLWNCNCFSKSLFRITFANLRWKEVPSKILNGCLFTYENAILFLGKMQNLDFNESAVKWQEITNTDFITDVKIRLLYGWDLNKFLLFLYARPIHQNRLTWPEMDGIDQGMDSVILNFIYKCYSNLFKLWNTK